jgi:hypothetical protein
MGIVQVVDRISNFLIIITITESPWWGGNHLTSIVQNHSPGGHSVSFLVGQMIEKNGTHFPKSFMMTGGTESVDVETTTLWKNVV